MTTSVVWHLPNEKEMSDNQLFSSYHKGGISLKNRVVMAPMTRSRAVVHNTPNELMAEYYEQRAEAGLIITEGTAPSPSGLGYPRIPGLYNQAQADGWKLVTDAVHKHDSKIFLQIMHTGRISHEKNFPEGGKFVAPSAIAVGAPFNQMYVDGEGMLEIGTPAEMTANDINEAIAEYVKSAELAIEAGFDGVEIHAANGYLPNQFINPKSNQRNDEYGGSIENRARFVIEVTRQTVEKIGADKVGVRLSPYGVFNGMGEFEGIDEQYVHIAKALNALNIAYIHLADMSAMTQVPVPFSIKEEMKAAFDGTLILNGAYDAARAGRDIAEGKTDLVAFGIPFIANPDLVTRLKDGIELSAPDQATFYTPGPEGYTTYPKAGE